MLLGSRLATVAFAAAAAALALAYGVFLMAPAAGIFHDDGVYLVTAKALAEGSGYRIVSLPWEPAQTKYPVLFPWLVSLVWRLAPGFPENLPWLRLVPLGAGVIWLLLSWRLLRRLGTSREACAVGLLLVAVSPWVVFVSTATLAETVFSALLIAGVLLLVRIEAGQGRRFESAAAGVLLGASLLTRAAGAAPVVAGLLVLVVRRRWQATVEYATGVLVVYLPWTVWVAMHPPASAIDTFYQGSIYGTYNLITHFDWPEKMTVFGLNAVYLASMGQYWGLAGASPAAIAVGLVGSGLIVKGLWTVRTTPIAIVVVLYLGMLLLFVWPPFRYVVPIMPLLVWLALQGAGRWTMVVSALAVVMLLTGGLALVRTTVAVQEKGGTWFTAAGVDEWHDMRAQYDWISRETSRDAVIAGVHDPTYYLFTGRKALRPFSFNPILISYNVRRSRENPFGTVSDFRKRLVAMKADYVVLTPRDGVQRLTGELLEAVPGSLIPVFGNDPSGHLIYRVDRTLLSSSTPE